MGEVIRLPKKEGKPRTLRSETSAEVLGFFEPLVARPVSEQNTAHMSYAQRPCYPKSSISVSFLPPGPDYSEDNRVPGDRRSSRAFDTQSNVRVEVSQRMFRYECPVQLTATVLEFPLRPLAILRAPRKLLTWQPRSMKLLSTTVLPSRAFGFT
jgi:hypothetical protein